MQTGLSSPLLRVSRTFAAGALLLLALTSLPCHAQYAPPPGGYGPPNTGGFPGSGPYSGPPPPGQTPQPTLPEGVNQLYALQGTNQILAYATPGGYDRLLELIRNLDGDLDILRTKVVSVEARTSELAALGVTVGADSSALSPSDSAKLLAALGRGDLRVIETLRVTTRENTAVATLLRRPGARNADGGTPFTLIPREGRNGALTLEIHEPTGVQVSVQSGQTAVIILPSLATGTVRLLFLTPAVLSSASRPLR